MGLGAGLYYVGFMVLPMSLLYTKMRWRSFLLVLLVIAVLAVALAVTGYSLGSSLQTEMYGILFGAGFSLLWGCMLDLLCAFLTSVRSK
jgi:hypothetical protein